MKSGHNPSPSTLGEVSLPWDIRAKHETLFSVFLLILAFLFRNHSSITYPALLYVFIAFLSFNFLYNRFLKQAAHNLHLAYSPVFINGILITSAIHYSGGQESYLWVMYLLPIFTACLLFDGRGIVLSTVYVSSLHASIYGDGLWTLDGADWLQFLSRVALLALSASVTWRLASTERSTRAAALAERKNYEEVLRRLQSGGDGAVEPPLEGGLLARGIHDVNTALTVILGSAQLVMSHAPEDWGGKEDMTRVESAVRLSKLLLQNLFLLNRAKDAWKVGQVSGHSLLKESLDQYRGEMRSRRVSVNFLPAAPVDAFQGNAHLLQQAFMNFIFTGLVSTPPEGKVSVSSRSIQKNNKAWLELLFEDEGLSMEGEGIARFFDPHWVGPGRGKGLGLGLFLGKEIIRRHGGDVSVEPRTTGGNRLTVTLPQERPTGGDIRLEELAGKI